MPYVLSAQQQEEIFQAVKLAFPEFPMFDNLVGDKLKRVIADTNEGEIDMKSAKKVTERYYDTNKFQTEAQKLVLTQIHLILRTCYVLILSYHPRCQPLKFPDIATLLREYPSFIGQDEQELRYLLKFRNYLRIALEIFPARLNKQMLLKIAAHLEGSGKEYITGGGQKPCVTRRVQIYEHEGSVHAEKRQERSRAPRTTGQKRKRPTSQPTVKEVRLLRLPSDEIRALRKGPDNIFTNVLEKIRSNNNNSGSDNILYSSSKSSVNSNGHSLPFNEKPILKKEFGQRINTMGLNLSAEVNMTSSDEIAPTNISNSSNSGLEMNYPEITELTRGLTNFSSGEMIADLQDLLSYMPDGMKSSNGSNIILNSENVATEQLGPPLEPGFFASGNYQYVPNSFNHSYNVPGSNPPSSNTNSSNASFPPIVSFSRAQSEILDRLLDDDAYYSDECDNSTNGNNYGGNDYANAVNSNVEMINPVKLMRTISWEIYNGSFNEDLKALLSP